MSAIAEVERTGVAVGAAAYLRCKYDTFPRQIDQQHLAELQSIVGERDDCAGSFEPSRH